MFLDDFYNLNGWFHQPVMLKTLGILDEKTHNLDVPITLGQLLFAGMPQEDFKKIAYAAKDNEGFETFTMLLAAHEDARKAIKEANISPAEANFLLLNIGEYAYIEEGNRDFWAVYAYKKIHPKNKEKPSGLRMNRLLYWILIIPMILFGTPLLATVRIGKTDPLWGLIWFIALVVILLLRTSYMGYSTGMKIMYFILLWLPVVSFIGLIYLGCKRTARPKSYL